MINKIIIALMMIALPVNLVAQTANEIIEKHTKDAAAALEEYLQKNPKASDSNDAINFLIESYSRLGMTERQAELLSAKYEKLPKGEDLVPQEFFGVFQELFRLYLQSGSKDKAKVAIENAKKDIAGHPDAARFGGFIDQLGGQLNTPAVGDVMDIKFTGLDGKETDLAKMKGKVVLIDFLATWCGPCIAELPNVLKAYEEYNDKGFEIIGISLDNAKDEDKLRTFVKDKKMTWPHAFDGQGWRNSLAKKFGISSIPATFLIGKDGKVVSTNLRGPALSKAVKKELGL
ncbi:MAG: TlpA disulfide reductase family protein [Verrucomicrobiota bacterium]|nr:TlpA disulfide reductase family protein [Verrucomicrobiota bacterium]